VARLPAFLAIVLSALVPLAPADAAPASGSDAVTGMWINPHHSVAVQNQFCGNALCGHVVWASADAKADARDSGVASLIGTDLLQDYRPSGRGSWKGTVFVPDLGRRFSSEIDVLAADRIRISGCILHGLICKSQIWTRIGALPQ
jgi:uncharacterized protein (DUF2147 family)